MKRNIGENGNITELLTLTDCTAPNGPKSCHKTFSSVSGAKLYTKIHQPDPLIGFVESIELAKISFVNGEYLEDAKLYLSIVNIVFKILKYISLIIKLKSKIFIVT